MIRQILKELRNHLPFTALGALGGIVFMMLFHRIPHEISHKIFFVLHPIHVLLSALVTASMYKIHQQCRPGQKCNHWMLLIVGYVGAVGVATVSDSVIPYLGEILLKLPRAKPHIGFIEMWWLVNPLAIIGILIAYFKPNTKVTHAGHVLLSTWASLFHMMMAMGSNPGIMTYAGLFVFLVVAVWLPCCFSDIMFPLLFVKDENPEGHSCCGCSKQ